MWASKRHAADSSITVGRAVVIPDPGGAYSFNVTTTASSQKPTFKEEISEQVTVAAPLPDGQVAMQIAFTVGPTGAWPNLWKATIDALGPILGHDDGARRWNSRDGRITDLGLHCTVDPAYGNRVAIAIRADTSAD